MNQVSTADWVKQTVERYEGPLTIYAARLLTGDVDRARDVVQDTFLRLWQADRESVEGHLAKWLYTVCRNRAFDVHRKEHRMTTVEARQMDQTTSSEPSREDPPDTLVALVDALPPRQQEAVRLKFQGGLSYREIAEVMDTTVNNVGVLLHTAVGSIRAKLTDHDSHAMRAAP